MLVRGSRWSKSDLTYGPIGRVVATVLLLVPLWWFLTQMGIFGLVGVVTYGFVLVPWALRDIWRPARRKPTADEELQARLATELARDRAAREDPGPSGREAPRRW